MSEAKSEPSLVTFPPSLDCELARFLLGQYRVPYVEDRHTLIFSFAVTWWKAGTLHFPLLAGAGRPPFDSVRTMIDGLDPLAPSDLRLLPLLGMPERDAVEADWPRFNATLGGAVAVFSYFHLLPHRSIMLRPHSAGTPWFERLAVWLAYPLFRGLLTFLKLSAANAAAALARIRSVVASVDARLAGGRPYLVGDRFTLSDMAFANALGPLVLPPRYGGPLPTYAQMPPILQQTIAEMRARPGRALCHADPRGAPPVERGDAALSEAILIGADAVESGALPSSEGSKIAQSASSGSVTEGANKAQGPELSLGALC